MLSSISSVISLIIINHSYVIPVWTWILLCSKHDIFLSIYPCLHIYLKVHSKDSSIPLGRHFYTVNNCITFIQWITFQMIPQEFMRRAVFLETLVCVLCASWLNQVKLKFAAEQSESISFVTSKENKTCI